MDTPEEIARDEWLAQVTTFAIEEHAFDQLRSYYVAYPDLLKRALQIFDEGSKVVNVSPSAAVILYMTVFEVTFKSVILKPILFGLVHNDALADMVSDVVMRGGGVERHRSMLSVITKEFGAIDLENVRLGRAATGFWTLFGETMKVRNLVTHQGVLAEQDDAEDALELAMWVLFDVLPAILVKCGMLVSNRQIVSSLNIARPPPFDPYHY